MSFLGGKRGRRDGVLTFYETSAAKKKKKNKKEKTREVRKGRREGRPL